MEENVIGNQPISITDPKAHIMLDKDHKWGFIVDYFSFHDTKILKQRIRTLKFN